MLFFFFNDTATTEIYTLSLHDALPISTLEQLAAGIDAVVSCVSADADVLEVARALAAGLKSGMLMLDCSTIGAETARQAAELLAPRGVEFLDCPVSGGVEGDRKSVV